MKKVKSKIGKLDFLTFENVNVETLNLIVGGKDESEDDGGDGPIDPQKPDSPLKPKKGRP